MPYKANRGGKAPIRLRRALLRYLDIPVYYPVNLKLDTVIVGSKREILPLEWLVGQLWNCTNKLPRYYYGILHLPSGSTYAKAVRTLSMSSLEMRI